MKIMSQEAVKELLIQKLKQNYNKYFSVYFIKKDGSGRYMLCRLNTDAYTKGGSLPYDPLEKGLLNVEDRGLVDDFKAGLVDSVYRNVNLSTIQELKMEGEHIFVGDREK